MLSLIPDPTLDALCDTAATTPPGCFVEVGVYRGGSAIRLYEISTRQSRVLHLFDTFCGMPFADLDDIHPAGSFADGIDLPALRVALPRAVFHVGLFPETLPADLTGIAFAHIDCDQYRSVLASIDTLWPRMVTGAVLWFDDYGLVPAARRAVLERFPETELHPAPEDRMFVRKP